jgi:hypothetical protein
MGKVHKRLHSEASVRGENPERLRREALHILTNFFNKSRVNAIKFKVVVIPPDAKLHPVDDVGAETLFKGKQFVTHPTMMPKYAGADHFKFLH